MELIGQQDTVGGRRGLTVPQPETPVHKLVPADLAVSTLSAFLELLCSSIA